MAKNELKKAIDEHDPTSVDKILEIAGERSLKEAVTNMSFGWLMGSEPSNESFSQISTILVKYGAKLDKEYGSKSLNRITPLEYAVERDLKDTVLSFIESGAKVGPDDLARAQSEEIFDILLNTAKVELHIKSKN